MLTQLIFLSHIVSVFTLTCRDVKSFYNDNDNSGASSCCAQNADHVRDAPGCIGAVSPFVDGAQDKLDALATLINTEGVGHRGEYRPQIGLAVSKDGHYIHSSSGVADHLTNEPFTSDTPYAIASAGKMLNGLMYAKAIDAGYISDIYQTLGSLHPALNIPHTLLVPLRASLYSNLTVECAICNDTTYHLRDALMDGLMHDGVFDGKPVQARMLNVNGSYEDPDANFTQSCAAGEMALKVVYHPDGIYETENTFTVGSYTSPIMEVGVKFSDTFCVPVATSIEVTLKDSYGDGWNGNALVIYTLEGKTTCSKLSVINGNTQSFSVQIQRCPDPPLPYSIMMFVSVRRLTVADILSESIFGTCACDHALEVGLESDGWDSNTYSTFKNENMLVYNRSMASQTTTMVEHVDTLFNNWSGYLTSDPGTWSYGSGTSTFAGMFLQWVVNSKDGNTKTIRELAAEWFAPIDLKFFHYGYGDYDLETGDLKSEIKAQQWDEPVPFYYAMNSSNRLYGAKVNGVPYTHLGATPRQMQTSGDKLWTLDDDVNSTQPASGFPGMGSLLFASTRSMIKAGTLVANYGKIDGVQIISHNAMFQVFEIQNKGQILKHNSILPEYGRLPPNTDSDDDFPSTLVLPDQNHALAYRGGLMGFVQGVQHREYPSSSWMVNTYLSNTPLLPSWKGWGGATGPKQVLYTDQNVAVYIYGTRRDQDGTSMQGVHEWLSSLMGDCLNLLVTL